VAQDVIYVVTTVTWSGSRYLCTENCTI